MSYYRNKNGYFREYKPIIFGGLAIVVIVFIDKIFKAFNQLLVSFGLAKSDEQKAIEDNSKQAEADFLKQNAGVTLTKTALEWGQIAGVIYEDLRYSSIDDNKADAVYQLCRPKNIMDVYELVKQFGSRQEAFFGIPVGGKKTLPEFVRSNLSLGDINIINSNYSRKAIKYSF